MMPGAKQKAQEFCQQHGLRIPILLAPMAGACPVSLSIAVANAGGMGACGALLMQPDEIVAWATEVRSQATGPFQINLWIPDPPPRRDPDHEARVRKFLARFGPDVPVAAGDATPPDFDAQCDALLNVRPPMVSSVMGLYPPAFVQRLKRHGIKWCANISTVAEAIQAATAGADLLAAQGAEAGGHRGCFNAGDAERKLVGLFSLIPAVVDAVRIPVIATGGIADARGIAAALTLGASAVQIGTGFLRCPEAKLHPAWADALARTAPEQTMLTRAFSGRAGRSIATNYVQAAASPDAPAPAPYPVQRGLTAPMRADAQKQSDVHRMQPWAGQSAALAHAEPAADLIEKWWRTAQQMLP
jgi:nitronate monooxygenase